MPYRPPTSRSRYEQYRADFKAHRTEGSSTTAAAHAQRKGRAQRSFTQLFTAFWGLLRGIRGTVVFALTTVTIATGLKLIPPAATGFILDNILGTRPLPTEALERFGLPEERDALLRLIAIGMVIIAAVGVVVGVSGRYLTTLNVKRIQSRVRRRLFAHTVRLPLHRVYALKSGGAASVLREDAGGVGDLLFSMIYNPWRAIVQLTGTLIVLATIDWRLLVGSLVIIPTVFVTHRTWIARIRPLFRDIRAARQHMDGHATESFGGMRVVRSFGRQRTETGRFIRNNHLMIRQEMLAWVWSRTVDIAWSLLIPIASAALLWYGGSRILADGVRIDAGTLTAAEALTTGDLVMFLFYLAMLLEPLATLASSATGFQNNLAGLDRVLDLLAEEREFADAPGTRIVVPDRVDGALELRDVRYRYPGRDEFVIDGINLDVPAGSTIAFVGPSGSGKTTLSNLIARFDDPTSGTIRLDGIDLREIDVESYRNLLGVVEQDIFLFDGTIGENIAYGRRDATPEQVEVAARRAHAVEFIDRLDKGYDTLIGERGVKLSGGQRQRLAIARALLADPRILILDEATSNLDTESERLIQESLEHLMRGRTSFVIAHRLSTIAHADVIVVLEAGRIVEMGTHAELVAGSGRYERMVAMQTAGADRPAGSPRGTAAEAGAEASGSR